MRRDAHRVIGRAGFTIVEMVVVIVILGVLAVAVGPRVRAFFGRETRGRAEAVSEVLSAAARRDALTSQRVGVEYDAESGRMRVMVFGEQGWREDRLSAQAIVAPARVERVQVDTSLLDPERWRVEFPRNEPRPPLRVVISDTGGKETYTVLLPGRAQRAIVARTGEAVEESDEVIDLDAIGRGDQAW
jgi:prepilin-type N-terminal cleavage/methylation domain-containing protein